LVERRFLRTRSRWPRAMDRDWGGLRRKSGIVRPRILRYPRRNALRRVVLVGEPRAREIEGAGDVRGEGSVFDVGDGRGSGVDG